MRAPVSGAHEACSVTQLPTNPMPATPLLDKVDYPDDLKKMDDRDLPQLAAELRAEMVDAVSRTGGTWARASASSN